MIEITNNKGEKIPAKVTIGNLGEQESQVALLCIQELQNIGFHVTIDNGTNLIIKLQQGDGLVSE